MLPSSCCIDERKKSGDENLDEAGIYLSPGRCKSEEYVETRPMLILPCYTGQRGSASGLAVHNTLVARQKRRRCRELFTPIDSS